MKQTHIFNARYREDIYGVIAIISNGDAACVQIKYQVALQTYKKVLKKMMEDKLANDAIFRKEFLRGDIVHFDIPQEGLNNGE